MRPILTALLPACCWLGLCCGPVRGDGGVVRLSERRGGYRITVFTSPTPLRAGPVDVSVLVQDAESGTLVADARVTVRAVSRSRPGLVLVVDAVTEAATNKLYRAALFEIPESGWWEIETQVSTASWSAAVKFDVEVGEPTPRWLDLVPWLCWPVPVVALFLLHCWLVSRRGRTLQKQSRPG